MDTSQTNQTSIPYVDNDLAQQFNCLSQSSFDAILQIMVMFQGDKCPEKVNLGVGAYRDQNGKPYVFDVVRKAEQEIIKNLDKQYLPDSYKGFNIAARKTLFGFNSPAVNDERIATIQTISGTGALYLGFSFIANYLPKTPRTVYISDPTWPTHPDVIETSGLKVAYYPYYNPQTKGLDFQSMIKFFSTIQKGSIILLQSAGHNPTGVDLNKQQWKQVCKIMIQRNLIPFFDPAYQGFATGDLDADAWAIRYFLQQGFYMFVAQSFSKNLGLYGQRIGALHIVTPNKQCAWRAYTKIRSKTRKQYLVAPSHGAFIVDKVVNNQNNYNSWISQLRDKVAATVKNGRKLLRDQLQRINTPGTWNHITDQTGMFSFTGLTPRQCDILINKHHVYLIKNGRVAVSMINESNYKKIAESIKLAIEQSIENPQ